MGRMQRRLLCLHKYRNYYIKRYLNKLSLWKLSGWTYWKFFPCWLVGLDVVWPHHSFFPYHLSCILLATLRRYIPRFLGQGLSGSVNLMSYSIEWEYIYQRLVTLTTMLLKGPVKAGENGSAVPVKRKQRPQASPGPRPGGAPNASWFIAAVNPLPVMPQAICPKKKYQSTVISDERSSYHHLEIHNRSIRWRMQNQSFLGDR